MDISKDMARIAVEALEEKKAEDVKVIEISNISVIADYFIIANGTNSSQVQALVDGVEDSLGKQGYLPKRIEGTKSSNWILMDYGDVIIHVFSKDDRLFYDLERIWGKGTNVTKEELIQ